MNSTLKYILPTLVFLASTAVGYVGASAVKKGMASRPTSPKPSNETVIDRSPVEVTPAAEVPAPAATVNLQIESIGRPKLDAGTGKYSFTVEASGSVQEYILYDASDQMIRRQPGNRFEVAAVAGGKYIVRVADLHGNVSPPKEVTGCYAVQKVNKLSAGELETILNSGRASSADTPDFKSRVSPSLVPTVVGMEQGERVPQSVNELIMKISNGIWDSVSVQSVDYDPLTNRMTRATVKVNYPD